MNGHDMDNPWAVGKIEDFLYFCCPECDLSRETIYQSRELFLQHALNQHPKAKECLPQIEIKLELKEEISEIPTNFGATADDYIPEVECKLDEDYDDDYKISNQGNIEFMPKFLKI